ncbi:hypothetical protein JNJ66_04535 [Candidatus Saccharibacteria bacterium]|nr:hypothetical protein [Candidatus Saccharibacteria bacterium]
MSSHTKALGSTRNHTLPSPYAQFLPPVVGEPETVHTSERPALVHVAFLEPALPAATSGEDDEHSD